MEDSGRNDSQGAGEGGSCGDVEGNFATEAQSESSGSTQKHVSKKQYHEKRVALHREAAQHGYHICFACGERRVLAALRMHPCLNVHICRKCLNIYKTGSFDKDTDGHEKYCRMCGNGGDIFWCDEVDPVTKQPCPYSFCAECIEQNFGASEVARLEQPGEKFTCWLCDDDLMEELRRRIPGYAAGSKRLFSQSISKWWENGDRSVKEPIRKPKGKRSRSSDEHEPFRTRARLTSPSSWGKGKTGRGKGKGKSVTDESRRVSHPPLGRRPVFPSSSEGLPKSPPQSLKSTDSAPMKAKSAENSRKSILITGSSVLLREAAPLPPETALKSTESVAMLTESALKSTEWALKSTESTLNSTESAAMMTESALKSTESVPMLAESAPTSKASEPMRTGLESFWTESAAEFSELIPTDTALVSTPTTMQPAPMSTELSQVLKKLGPSPKKSAPTLTGWKPASKHTGSTLMLTEPARTSTRTASAPRSRESGSASMRTVLISERSSTVSVLMSTRPASRVATNLALPTESTPKTPSSWKVMEPERVCTKSAPVSTESVPAVKGSSPKLTASAAMSKQPAPTSSGVMPTNSAPMTLQSSQTSSKSVLTLTELATMSMESAPMSRERAPRPTRSRSMSTASTPMSTESTVSAMSEPMQTTDSSMALGPTATESAPIMLGSTPIATGIATGSAPTSTESAPTYTGSTPTSMKSAPNSTELHPISTKLTLISTDSASMLAESVQMTPESESTPKESVWMSKKLAPTPKQSTSKSTESSRIAVSATFPTESISMSTKLAAMTVESELVCSKSRPVSIKSILTPSESAQKSDESASMSTESSMISTELEPPSTESSRMSESETLRLEPAPTSTESTSVSVESDPKVKDSALINTKTTESALTSTPSTSVYTGSIPKSKTLPPKSTTSTPISTGSGSISAKSAPISAKSATMPAQWSPISIKSVLTSPASASVLAESGSESTDSAPELTEYTPLDMKSAQMSTESTLTTTSTAQTTTESATKTVGLASGRGGSLSDAIRSPSSSRDSVGEWGGSAAVGSGSCYSDGNAEATDGSHDGSSQPAAGARNAGDVRSSSDPSAARLPEGAPLRCSPFLQQLVLKHRLPPGPGRGATYSGTSVEALAAPVSGASSESAVVSHLQGVIRSVAEEVSIEGGAGGRWPSSFETGLAVGGGLTSDSEEDDPWERLSTDSSDSGSSSDGDWNKSTKCSGARLGTSRIRHARDRARQRVSQPKFFEWDRRKEGYIEDLSAGMEKNVRVQVRNDVDSERLPYFRYVTGYVMGEGVQQNLNPDAMVCCDCSDGCRDPNICACLRLQARRDGSYSTVTDGRGAVSRGTGGIAPTSPGSEVFEDAGEGSGFGEEDGGGRFYSDEGLLLRERRTIFECHARCSCNPKTCNNRVVSRGVHLRLQVFRCAEPEKGWGLRCLDTIPAGTFVACYLGEVLRERDVDEHGKLNGDDYLFGLDFWKRQAPSQNASHGKVMSPVSPSPRSSALGLMASVGEALVFRSLAAEARGGHREGASSAAATAPGANASATGGKGSELVDLCDSQSGDEGRLGSSSPRQRAVAWKRPKLDKARGSAPLCSRGKGFFSSSVAGGMEDRGGWGSKCSGPDEKEALMTFMEVTGEQSREKALFFLQGAGQRPDVALNHYYTFDHSKPFLYAPDKIIGDEHQGLGKVDVEVSSGGQGNITAGNEVSSKDEPDAMDLVGEETGGRAEGVGNQRNREFQRLEREAYIREERCKKRAMQQAIAQRRTSNLQGNGPSKAGVNGLSEAAVNGPTRSSDGDDAPCAPSGNCGAGVAKSCGVVNDRTSTCSPQAGLSDVGALGADGSSCSPQKPESLPTPGLPSLSCLKPTPATPVQPNRGPQPPISGDASKSNHQPEQDASGSPVGAMRPADGQPEASSQGKVLCQDAGCEIAEDGERSTVHCAALSPAATLPSDARDPQDVKAMLLEARSVNDVSNGEAHEVAKPRQTVLSSSQPDSANQCGAPDVNNHDHPKTPPRKTNGSCQGNQGNPATPGRVSTPRTTLEEYGFSPVSSPKRPWSTPTTGRTRADENPARMPMPATERRGLRIDGAASQRARAIRADLQEGSSGVKSCVINFDPNGKEEGASAGACSAGTPTSPGQGSSPETLVVDAKAYGNVARFMNHSCAGNLNKHMVFVESHDARMPRVAFFAPQIIPAMEELTYDYGYVVGAVEGKNLSCHCGASSCRGRLL